MIHFSEKNKPACGRWSLIESVHSSSNPRKVTCHICERYMKKIFHTTNTMDWCKKSWDEFMGRGRIDTVRKVVEG